MKKIIAILLSVLMVLSLAACGASESTPTEKAEETKAVETTAAPRNDTETAQQVDTSAPENGEKVLVVYFSANNYSDVDTVSSATPMIDGVSATELIAQKIHDTVGGEIAPIIPAEDYPTGYDEVADQAKNERDNGDRPAFTLSVDPTEYDTIFIGYPIWWYEMPMVMDTFFETYDFSGKTIIPFNTHAGSRDGGTYDDIRDLEPNATVLDGYNVTGGTDKATVDSEVESWLNDLDY